MLTQFLTKKSWFLWGLLFICAAFLHTILLFTYNHNHIYGDDTWTLSAANSYYNYNVPTDCFHTEHSPQWEILHKTYHLTYAPVLNILGWKHLHSLLITKVLFLGSLLCWYFILKEFKLSRTQVLFILLMMLTIQPFMGVSNRARYEALCFLLINLSTLAVIKRAYFPGVLCALLALEAHLMALIGLGIPVFLLLQDIYRATKSRNPIAILKTILPVAGAITLFSIYYFYLNGAHFSLHTVQGLSGYSGNHGIKNHLYTYFIETPYYAHIPTLVLLLGAIGLVFRQKEVWQSSLFWIAAFNLGFAIVFSFLLPKSGIYYAIYVFPALLLFAAMACRQELATLLFSGLLIFVNVPQYAYKIYKHGNFSMQARIDLVQPYLRKDEQVLGHQDFYFAYPDLNYYGIGYDVPWQDFGLKQFVFIEDQRMRESYPQYKDVLAQRGCKPTLRQSLQVTELEQINLIDFSCTDENIIEQ